MVGNSDNLHLSVSQIWTLLPSFCTHPTDVVASFKGLARTLGMAISDHSYLRLIVCQALRRLINKGCQTGKVYLWRTCGPCSFWPHCVWKNYWATFISFWRMGMDWLPISSFHRTYQLNIIDFDLPYVTVSSPASI